MIGLVASQFFVYLYFKSSSYIKRFGIVSSSIISIAGYLLVAWLLHFIKLDKYAAIFIPIFSIGLFVYLFKEIKDEKIGNMRKWSYKVLLIWALFAALIILVITRSGTLLGATWAGLFSAFPITLFPLMLIVHFTYDTKHVHTIIKNFPRGLGALIVYSLTVSISYPTYGIYIGTAMSFLMATAYLFVYGFLFMHRAMCVRDNGVGVIVGQRERGQLWRYDRDKGGTLKIRQGSFFLRASPQQIMNQFNIWDCCCGP